jgi:hypothetical protein
LRGVTDIDANGMLVILRVRGAVMRSTQRLFGITDRHCIDVEVWQSLSRETGG